MTTPGWYSFSIDGRRASIVSDGPITGIEPAAEFPSVAPGEIADALRSEFLPTEHLVFEQNCLVADFDGRQVLFDTGMGESKFFGPHTGRLVENLRAAGYAGEDIDAVVLTHAHPDHCFGLTDDDGAPRFPNARVYISRTDYEYWTDAAKLGNEGFLAFNVAGAIKSFRPYLERLTLLPREGEVFPGVSAISSSGHTVGHTSFLLSAGAERYLLLGDVAYHTCVMVRHPLWLSSFDTDPHEAVQTRLRMLELAASERMHVMGYHFPFPGIGHIARDGESYRFIPEPMNLI